MAESRHKNFNAHMVKRKGVDESLARVVCSDLDQMGYRRTILRSDGEASILALAERIKDMWSGEIVLENSPAGESQSTGQAEKAVQTLVGQVRTMKLAYEAAVGQAMPADSKALQWLVEHAACVIKRYSVGKETKSNING